MDELDLGTLVRDAARGDEQAWAALVNRFAGLVWAVARGHGLDHADAADVSQTTWLRLAEQLSFIRDPDRLGAWLATTARRESLRTLRRHERHVSVEECVDWVCGDIALELTDSLETRERRRGPLERVRGLAWQLQGAASCASGGSAAELCGASDLFEMPIGSIGPTRARCLDRLRDRIAPLPERPKRRRTVGSTAKEERVMRAGDGSTFGVLPRRRRCEPLDWPNADRCPLAKRHSGGSGNWSGKRDRVPEDVLSSARASFQLRSIDDELAALVYDSKIDEAPLAGVRSSDGSARQLTFAARGLVLEIQISEDRHLVGQVVPPQAVVIELRHRSGTIPVKTDELGWFQVPAIPDGPVSFRCRPVRSSEESVATSWITF